MTKKRVTPDMYALSTIIFLVMLILLIALNVIQNRAENGSLRNREKVAK